MRGKNQNSIRSIHREVPSQMAAVDSLCAQTKSLLELCGLSKIGFAAELVAREALNNAVIHGNRGRTSKKVTYDFAIGRRWVRIKVKDEGNGFNWRQISRRSIPDDRADHGRGIPISIEYSKKVRFNQRGNQISIWLEKNL